MKGWNNRTFITKVAYHTRKGELANHDDASVLAEDVKAGKFMCIWN